MAQNEILLRLKGTSDFSDIQSDVAALQKHFSKLNLPKNVTKNLENNFDKLDKELQKFQEHMNSGFKTKSDVTGLEKSGQKIIQIFNTIESTIDGIDTSDLKKAFQIDTSKLDKAQQDVKDIKTEIKNKLKLQLETDNSGKKIRDFQSLLNNLYKTSKTKKLDVLRGAVESGDIQQIKEAVSELDKYGQSLKGNAANATSFNNALKQIAQAVDGVDTNEFSELNNKLIISEQKVVELSNEIDNKLNKALQETPTYVGSVSNAFKKLGGEIELNAKNQQQFNNEMAQVKDQIAQFFSLINVAQLLRRAFQDVYNTVKELDAVMTETAVVTDFSIGDMWDKLPEYTAQAKALGVATKDLYAATTLYYQQGLDTNASMAAGVETMKMARIAGMEATQATDAMTAALRGFNMEVNETNAQNVNDVYSKLAAITASDTEEIATAMSKTAAIANSVGAEFENIAVFLAQGIETTRESADAIGTAMKTILARFNEMKKDPSEIGEIDGEIVDANKVETALRSVGIALRDTNGEFRNADQVLLEVAEKWDSMSVMQQRYIATTAAGSRQQSRFIAFMQDYNRTMELQTAAYNAEGAAQQQYEKTLESLDAKVAKLKDTWDEFILGIANSDVIKGAIDFLSGLLDVVNKMTNAPGILGGVLKSLMAFGVFKGGKALIGKGGLGERLFDASQIAKSATREGQSASEAFREAFEKSSKKNGKNMLQSMTSIFKKDTWKVPMPKIDMKGEYSKEIKNLQNQLNNSIQFQLDDWEIDAKTDEIQRLTNAISDNNNIKELQKQANRATQSQISAYNAAIANGIPVEEASVLLTKKGTLEEYKAIAAKKLGTNATKEQTEELAKKMMTEAASNTVTKMGILTQARYLLQMVFGTQAARESAAAKLVEAGSTWTAKVAQDALNSSLLACPIGWVVAGIAALVAGLVLLAKWAKTQTLEYKMEQAAEATKRATWAANEAKTAYEDLLSSKEEYEGFQNALEDLTYGTLEWKKALVDANQQVLELLKTYPVLAKYISEDNQGALTISEEGWNEILETQMQNVEISQKALAVSQYQEHQLSRPNMDRVLVDQKTQEDTTFNEKLQKMFGYMGAAYAYGQMGVSELGNQMLETAAEDALVQSGASVDINAELLKAMEQGQTITDTSSAIYGELMEKTGLDSDKILEYATALKTTQLEIEEFANQSAIYAQQIGGSTKEIANLEEGDDLAWMLGQRFTAEYDELASKVEVPETYEKAVAEYASALGVSAEQIREQYSNDTEGLKALKADLKSFKISEEINKKSKEFAEAWVNFGNEAQEAISALLSQGGKSLTQDQINAFSLNDDGTLKTVEEQKKYLETLGITDENIGLFGYDTIDDMIKTIQDNITTANVALENSKENFTALMEGVETSWGGGIWKKLTDQMTSGSAKAFNDSLSSIMINMGTQGVDSYLNLVDYLVPKLTAGGQKKLLENLSLINLEDIENAEDLREALDNIGISAIELTDDELKELNKEIQAMAAVASRTIVDIDKAQKAIDAGVNSKKLLQEAIDDNEIEFSKEDYETLKAAGASSSDFFYDGETYTYLGDTVDLLQQIQSDTTAMRAKLLAQVEQDAIDGATIADWINGESITITDDFSGIGPPKPPEIYTRESLIQSALADEVIGDYNAQKLMEEIFGMNTTGWSDAYAKAQLQSYYDKYGLGGTTYTGNLTTLETMYDEEYGAIAASQSGIEDAEMYEKASVEAQKYQDKIKNNIELTEQEKIAYTAATKAMDKSTQALRVKGKALGMTDKELDEYLGEDGKGTGLLGQVVAEKELEQNLKKTTEATKDYFEALDNGATGQDRDLALAGIAKEADLNLGLEIDVDWLKEADNLEAFRKAINGTKEDFYSFISGLKDKANEFLGFANSAEEVSKAFTDAGIDVSDKANEMASITSMLDDLSFDIDGTADFTQIYNAIYAVVQDADQAAKILEQLAGTGVDFKVTYQTVEVSGYEAAQALSGQTGGSVYNNRRGNETLYFVRVPKITGYLTGGGSNDNSYSPSGGGGSGGGGGGSSDKYDSSADKYHNLQMDINATTEERNKLEEEYAELLEDEDASLSDIQEKQQAIVDSLTKENELIDQKIAGRQAQIEEAFANNDALSQYAYYDPETDSLKYKLDKNGNPLINSVTDSTVGEKFDEGWDEANSYLDDKNSLEETRSENEELIAEYTEAGKNDLDDSFNTLEKIERIENEITNLQAERNILMEDASENSEAILENYAKEKELLDQQLEAQKKLNEERIAQHNENLEKAQELGYMQYIANLGNGQFEVDLESINELPQATQDAIVDWVEKLNESGDAVQESTEAYNQAAQNIIDFEKKSYDEAFSYFDKIKNFLIEFYQREIDILQQENEAILEEEGLIFDSIQKSLEEQRQKRENQKTEKEIFDKEARLAYLQANTTGANDLEIKNLQKELQEQKEDYTDTLIDQKISELQRQNDEAAAQRERQIELAQAQLDEAVRSGAINAEVINLIAERNAKYYSILSMSEEFSGLTEKQKESFLKNLGAEYQSYMNFLSQYMKIGAEGTGYELGESSEQLVAFFKEFFKEYKEASRATVLEEGVVKIDFSDGKSLTIEDIFVDEEGNLEMNSFMERILEAALDGNEIAKEIITLEIFSSFSNFLKGFVGRLGGKTFATGGLADFTGPAWLDGTKQHPELVLNARDTENFIQLKDILSSAMKNIHSIKPDEKTGDVYYEIHIDVEKLSNDYDVDDVANRVKTIIAQDAMYRNNTVINRLR